MEQLTVQILDRDYRLSCEPAERDTLLAAVAHVDRNMRVVRDQGRIVGTERIAVFAALDIAGQLLSRTNPAARRADEVTIAATVPEAVDSDSAIADPEIVRRMQSIHALLDTALANQERLF